MAYFVIAGKENCLDTTHALYVAEYLFKNLPNFFYRKILTPEEEWPTWLDQTNSINNWHETRSPIIWKEMSMRGGKPYLIGWLSEFWEYCYDYYAFQSIIPKHDLEKIMADNMIIESKVPEVQSTVISIMGTSDEKMLELVVYELQNLHHLKRLENTQMRIYDKSLSDDVEDENFILETIESFRYSAKGLPQSIEVVCSQQDAIQNCDLLIVIENYGRLPKEEANVWLQRCRKSMLVLADDINQYAKRGLRVILNHRGPVCFNASVLMEYCTTIRLTSIVAVTADEGISIISMMAKKANEPVENFWCPPVWGFCGLLSYITLLSIPITCEVIKPYKRSLKTKESSNLPKGEIVREMRFLENVVRTNDLLYEEVEEKKAHERNELKGEPILAKVRALASLVRLWYADEISDDVISLGVCSNGAFGFPVGICFSQMVGLNEKRVWEPVSGLPIRSTTVAKIQAISLQVENTFKKFGLGQRFGSKEKFRTFEAGARPSHKSAKINYFAY